ncbi:MAG: hypothetical protein GYB67_12970 [Chloroflexi bacterium]|nr:hypothetical protein [Chloroflexota bacterium]
MSKIESNQPNRRVSSQRPSMPAKPASALQAARSLYQLETRRRNLQIKRHMLETRLTRLEQELAEVEAQITALGLEVKPPDLPIDPKFPTRRRADQAPGTDTDAADDSFTLSY